MELIFSGYGVDICKEADRYFLTYDAGGIVIHYKTIEISEAEALRARESDAGAHQVVLHHQNIEEFGGDYMERWLAGK